MCETKGTSIALVHGLASAKTALKGYLWRGEAIRSCRRCRAGTMVAAMQRRCVRVAAAPADAIKVRGRESPEMQPFTFAFLSVATFAFAPATYASALAVFSRRIGRRRRSRFVRTHAERRAAVRRRKGLAGGSAHRQRGKDQEGQGS